MSKKAGMFIISAGAAFLIAALLLFLGNRAEAEKAGNDAEAVYKELKEEIGARREKRDAAEAYADAEEDFGELPAEEPAAVSPTAYEASEDPDRGYAGYIDIPALGLGLPVMASWDYEKLSEAPCLQSGSPESGDLVIAAHNYSTHFGGLKELEPGDRIIFTDMEGVTYTYRAAKLEILDPEDTERVLESGYALVLYTCTWGGAGRVAVFCEISPPWG